MATTNEVLEKAQQPAMEARIRAGMLVSDYRRSNVARLWRRKLPPSGAPGSQPIFHRRAFQAVDLLDAECGRLEAGMKIESYWTYEVLSIEGEKRRSWSSRRATRWPKRCRRVHGCDILHRRVRVQGRPDLSRDVQGVRWLRCDQPCADSSPELQRAAVQGVVRAVRSSRKSRGAVGAERERHSQ